MIFCSMQPVLKRRLFFRLTRKTYGFSAFPIRVIGIGIPVVQVIQQRKMGKREQWGNRPRRPFAARFPREAEKATLPARLVHYNTGFEKREEQTEKLLSFFYARPQRVPPCASRRAVVSSNVSIWRNRLTLFDSVGQNLFMFFFRRTRRRNFARRRGRRGAGCGPTPTV